MNNKLILESIIGNYNAYHTSSDLTIYSDGSDEVILKGCNSEFSFIVPILTSLEAGTIKMFQVLDSDTICVLF
jgi:hypothetical protein